MKIEPISKTGEHYDCGINTSYQSIIEVLGFEPNVTDMDDTSKVKASWGFTVDGVRCGIWCYKHYGPVAKCKDWSFFGPIHIACALFTKEKIL